MLWDSWDTENARLKCLLTEKERQRVRLEEAVALFLADQIARLGGNSTVRNSWSLFAFVNVETRTAIWAGRLFRWVENTMPTGQMIGRVKGFFNFCKARGWVEDNPTCRIANIKMARSNRAAIFTDQQYAQILKAIPLYAPENVHDATRTA